MLDGLASLLLSLPKARLGLKNACTNPLPKAGLISNKGVVPLSNTANLLLDVDILLNKGTKDLNPLTPLSKARNLKDLLSKLWLCCNSKGDLNNAPKFEEF